MHNNIARKYPPGSIVAVQVGPVRHKGLVTDRIVGGLPTVISNSKKLGRVAEEPWEMFTGGRVVEHLGYPGQLPWHVVLARARSRVGQPWTITSNCEHFVAFAHGLDERSPTLRAVAAVSLAVVGVALFGSK